MAGVVVEQSWQRASLPSALGWHRWLAAGWLSLVVLMALAAPYLTLPYAPAAPDLAHISVSPDLGAANQHWLGTDPLGRDVFANLLFGCRTALLFSLPAAVLATLLGALLGGTAGFWGRRVSLPLPGWALLAGLLWWSLALPNAELGLGLGTGAILWGIGCRMARRRLPAWPVPLDALVLAGGAVLGTLPRLLLVLAVAAGGPLSATQLLALLVCTSWVSAARLVRAETLRVQVRPFVEAAHVLGLPAGQVWWRHVTPLALRPLQTHFPLSLASLIGLESTLSFLGIGLAPEVASWGRLLSAARLDLGAWWTAAFPILALTLTISALRALASTPKRGAAHG